MKGNNTLLLCGKSQRTALSNGIPQSWAKSWWFLDLPGIYRSVFRKLPSPAAHPNLSKTHDGTPQNFASQKGGYETIHGHKYVSTYKSLPYKSAGI
jgi:hypothetical protein